MDASAYHQLLQDVQEDLRSAERGLTELRQIRSYLRQKLKAAGNEGNTRYRGMLDEVQNDLAEAKRGVATLRSVAAYARRKLDRDAPPEPSVPNQDRESFELPAEPVVGPKASKRAAEADSWTASTPPVSRSASRESSRTAAPSLGGRKPSAAAEPAQEASSAGGSQDGMRTIEFGPDGFPLR